MKFYKSAMVGSMLGSVCANYGYQDFQTMCEWAMFQTSPKKILKLFNDDYQEVFGCEYPNQDRLIRWTIVLAEGNSELKKEHPEWTEWEEVNND